MNILQTLGLTVGVLVSLAALLVAALRERPSAPQVPTPAPPQTKREIAHVMELKFRAEERARHKARQAGIATTIEWSLDYHQHQRDLAGAGLPTDYPIRAEDLRRCAVWRGCWEAMHPAQEKLARPGMLGHKV